jgi:hypothetical protein
MKHKQQIQIAVVVFIISALALMLGMSIIDTITTNHINKQLDEKYPITY